MKDNSTSYEKLLDAHFIKYPGHSKILHTIFNPFMVALIILIATTAYIKIVDGDWTFALMVGFLCSCFLSMKMAMVSMQMTGHGVGLIKKGRLSVLGLPTNAVVILSILLSLIITITVLGYTAPGEGFERVQILGVSMLFGFFMSLLSWRFHSYHTNWYGSEYDARILFTNKGDSEEVIKKKIKILKEKGILY